MAKKRKAPKSFEQSQSTKSAKYDVEETFNDSEDDFFAGRDKILLDDSADSKRRRRTVEQEKDLQPSDEEILAYQDDDDGDEDVSEDQSGSDYDSENERQSSHARTKGNKHGSDELEGEEESDDDNWGTNKADYYGDDVIETEEQAKEEENEAKRLQQKQLRNMTEADFGFDENEWVEEKNEKRQGNSITEKLPEAQIPENATEQQKLDILKSRYPEFLPLADEFTSLQATKQDLDATALRISKSLSAGALPGDGLSITLKRNALAAYLATISMYFAIVSSSVTQDLASRKITAMPPLELHDHPVIQSLSRARQLWDQVADEEVAEPQLPVPKATQPLIPGQKSPTTQTNGDGATNGTTLLKGSKKAGKSDHGEDISNKTSKAKPKKSKTQADTLPTTSQKKKIRSKNKGKPLNLSDIIEDTKADLSASDSDFGDEQPLTEEQYAEKAKKRKSLRFYTSQIASKANKRGHASRDAGGDDDLPYKERQRDKSERLQREAEARGRQKPDITENFGDDDYDDLPAQRDTNDEYYDTLLNHNSKKKADKQAKAEAYAQAAKEGAVVYEEETVGPDGKRAITYAIAKNKGLTPKRSKDVRNPRVKKRKKYDEKMKKLGSMRQVYKGGEGRGGYGGELTGIKTNVVKSVKL